MLLLVHDQVLATDDSQEHLIFTLLHANDFIGFSAYRLKKLDRDSVKLLELGCAIENNLVHLRNQECIHGLQFQAFGALQVLSHDRNLEVMGELSCVDIKALLVGLVSNSISDLASKHHLIAPHEVKHNIIELRHKRLLIDEVEVDHVICRHLNSHIALDEVDVAPSVDGFVVGPLSDLRVWVLNYFEEKDTGGGTGDKRLVVD